MASDQTTTPNVGDQYRRGDYMWEIIEVSDDGAIKARRAGKVLVLSQKLSDLFPGPSQQGKSVQPWLKEKNNE